MSGVRVKYTARFRNARPDEVNGSTVDDQPRPLITRLARQLVLAHYVERLVEAGTLTSHAEAAQRLGVSRTRMAQIMRLLTLSPVIQEAILCGELEATERATRPATTEVIWSNQSSHIFSRERGAK